MRHSRQRLLPIVTLCLGITILLKSAGLLDAAFARSGPGLQGNAEQVTDHAAGGGNNPATSRSIQSTHDLPIVSWTDKPPPPPLCKPDPLDQNGERKILLHLKQRAEALDARAASLDQRERELDAARVALRNEVAALKPLAARLEAIHTAHKASDNQKWAALVSTYGTMEPRSAARIFDGLDPKIVFNVLKRMNSRKSALILANMDPQKAEAVTERLAGIQQTPMPSHPALAAALLPDGAQ